MSNNTEYKEKYRAGKKSGANPELSQDEYGFKTNHLDISDRFARDYLGYCEHFGKYGSSLDMRKCSIRDATHFLRNARDTSILDAAMSDIRVYINYCAEEQKNREKTIELKLNSIVNILDHIHTECNPGSQPTLVSAQIRDIDLKSFERIRPSIEREALTRDEVLRLIDAAGNKYPKRDSLIVRVLYETGMRNSDLRNLKKEHVDLEKNLIQIQGSKGYKENELSYIVPITQKLARLLHHWTSVERKTLLRNGDPGFVFLNRSGQKITTTTTITRIVKSTAEDIGIQEELGTIYRNGKEQSFNRVTPHTLRHSITTHLDNQNLDDELLKLFLGNEKTLDTYRADSKNNEEFDQIRGTLHHI